jgi:hypothetical protein
LIRHNRVCTYVVVLPPHHRHRGNTKQPDMAFCFRYARCQANCKQGQVALAPHKERWKALNAMRCWAFPWGKLATYVHIWAWCIPTYYSLGFTQREVFSAVYRGASSCLCCAYVCRGQLSWAGTLSGCELFCRPKRRFKKLASGVSACK